MGFIPSNLHIIDFPTGMLPIRYLPSLRLFVYSGRVLTCPPLFQNPGQDTFASSVGFLSTSIDALKLVMTAVLSTEPWERDPVVVRMPWNQELEVSTLARATSAGAANDVLPLKLGIYLTDSVVRPQPPIERGLGIVVEALRASGHKVMRRCLIYGYDIGVAY